MLAKDAAPFPIRLDSFFSAWKRDGTLRNRLRCALALAVEIETGNAVLVGSIVDQEIIAALDCIFAEANHWRRRTRT